MVKSIAIAIALIFSCVAFAEISQLNGWEEATIFQRICIVWGILVLGCLLYFFIPSDFKQFPKDGDNG